MREPMTMTAEAERDIFEKPRPCGCGASVGRLFAEIDALRAALDETKAQARGAALVAEARRVREAVIPAYLAIGPAGAFALAGMHRDLDAALSAALDGDVVEMLRVLESLKGWET